MYLSTLTFDFHRNMDDPVALGDITIYGMGVWSLLALRHDGTAINARASQPTGLFSCHQVDCYCGSSNSTFTTPAIRRRPSKCLITYSYIRVVTQYHPMSISLPYTPRPPVSASGGSYRVKSESIMFGRRPENGYSVKNFTGT